MTVGEKSWDALWAASAPKPIPLEADLVTDGWKSIITIAQMWGVGRCQADSRLRRESSSGAFERIEARVGPFRTRGFMYRPKAPGVTRLVR